MSVDLLKVSAWSNPKSVAGAIAGVLRERGFVDVQVIGAAALNQAVKAIAIARSYVAAEDLDPICTPAFCTIEIGGESRTAIRLRVEHRGLETTSFPGSPSGGNAGPEPAPTV
jgi:stage V sporulation protein S